MRSAVAPGRCGWNRTAIAAVVVTIASGVFFAAPADRAHAAAGPMKESMEVAINDELHDAFVIEGKNDFA